MSKSKSENPIILSQDIGYGFTKLNKLNPVGELEYMSFISLAPLHSPNELDLSFMGGRDTKIVDVDGTAYEIGPENLYLDISTLTRSLNSQFIYTEQYKALFYGALAYQNQSEIDCLVVGLPVNEMTNAHKLKGLLEGTHKVSKELTVIVKQVMCVPQPLGGLFYLNSHKSDLRKIVEDGSKEVETLPDIEQEVNLVIDPGYLTFDFMVANGLKPMNGKMDAHPGGVSKVLRAIADAISQEQGIHYDNLSAIDLALKNRKLKVNGMDVNLNTYIAKTKTVLEGSLNFMKNMIGDGSDIDNIFILGGGSNIFKKTIEAFYPKHKEAGRIFIVDDPQMAIVKGYQEIGQKYYKPQ